MTQFIFILFKMEFFLIQRGDCRLFSVLCFPLSLGFFRFQYLNLKWLQQVFKYNVNGVKKYALQTTLLWFFFIQPYNVNICGFQLLYISGNDDISKKVFFLCDYEKNIRCWQKHFYSVLFFIWKLCKYFLASSCVLCKEIFPSLVFLIIMIWYLLKKKHICGNLDSKYVF